MERPSALDKYLDMMKKVREIVKDKEIPDNPEPDMPARILMDNFELSKLRRRLVRQKGTGVGENPSIKK